MNDGLKRYTTSFEITIPRGSGSTLRSVLPKLIVGCTVTAGLVGCAAYGPREVADPNAITVKDAFLSIADGLKGFQDSLSQKKDFHLGVITCKIVVKFDIAATASQGGAMGMEVSPPTQFVQAKLSAQQNSNSTGARGNTVEIELDSIDTHVCPPGFAKKP